jgi:hypothetical protein
MAIFPPGELEKFVKKNLDKHIEDYMNKMVFGKERPLSSYFTTTSSTTSSTSTWTGSGLYYHAYTGHGEIDGISSPSSMRTSVSKPKVKEPDYIPSDEPSGRKRLEQEFKFDPAFLDMEGEDNVIIG